MHDAVGPRMFLVFNFCKFKLCAKCRNVGDFEVVTSAGRTGRVNSCVFVCNGFSLFNRIQYFFAVVVTVTFVNRE